MQLLHPLAISIGILGALAAWLTLGPLADLGLQLWAIFVAWGAFYHTGGSAGAIQKNTGALIFGSVIAWIVLIGVTTLAGSLGVPVAAFICVGLGAAAVVLAAKIPLFATIPASVYGFACVASYAMQSNKLGNLYDLSLVDNPLLNIVAALLIGTILGFLSETIGAAMAKSEETSVA
ncbi:DUF1097 domain-containing protein [Sedimentitalea sp. XS_ASV28]|uniref:DUF1097 domain-containing protein n=1 Tax=Sedimentitalea sp. XS_ASV28 TaxID=3241296 RepID=UPI00351674A3